MNKKKYLNILSIFLLVLLFTLSGTCYAFSLTEVEVMTNQVCSVASGAQINVIKGVLQSNAWLENKNNIPFGDYESLIIRGWRDSSVVWYVDFIPFTNDLVYSINTNGNLTWTGNFPTNQYRFDGHKQATATNATYIGYQNSGTYSSNSSFRASNNPNSDYIFYLIFTNNTIYNANNVLVYGLNYTANFMVNNGEHIVSGQGDYTLGTGFIGNYWYTNRENLYYVIYKNDSEIIINHDINYTEVVNGNYEMEYLVPSSALENGSEYSVALYYEENLIYKDSSVDTIIVAGGSSSGDSGGGGGSTDLTPTNNLISQVVSGENKIIQLIESGDKKADERDNFWRKTYNRFMQPSGEVLRQMTLDLINDLPFDSGELSGEIMVATAGLDLIEEQANDFVIHYDSFEPTFMGLSGKKLWSSGDINFSKMERDIPAVSRLMFYVRAILGFIFICALLHNVWRTLLLTLGISDRLYADEQEEIQKQASIEENWKTRRDYQNYNLWLWRHRK